MSAWRAVGIICVLARPEVNLAALRMALRLILNQIESRPRS